MMNQLEARSARLCSLRRFVGVALASAGTVAVLAGCVPPPQLPTGHGDFKWTDETPSWSPSGTKILFASNRTHPRSGIDQLYLMNADGTGVKRLTRDEVDAREASFSPDGKRIVYVGNALDASFNFTSAGQIYVMRADGSRQVSLMGGIVGDAFFPAWAPNGRLIAFLRSVPTDSGDTRTDLFVVKPNGRGLRELARNVDGWAFAWSPDGRSIAVSGDGELHRLPVTSQKTFRVPGGGCACGGSVTTDIVWSPDGSQIALVRGVPVMDGSGNLDQEHVWILDARDLTERQLTANVDSSSVGSFGVTLNWLPGRPRRLVVAGLNGNYVVNADGSHKRPFLSSSGSLVVAGPSPDGRNVLFVDGPADSYASAIFMARVDNHSIRRLTQVHH